MVASAPDDVAAANPSPSHRLTGRQLVLGTGGVLALVVAGWLGVRYWTVGRFIETTDDAYVQADAVIVAPKVAGYVDALLVDVNQSVKAGDVVARIDDRDYRVALDTATASEAGAHAAIANLQAQLVVQNAQVAAADASVQQASASLALAKRDDARRKEMARVGYGSDEQADTAATDVREKDAALDRLKASATAARQHIEVLNAQLQLAEADFAKAISARHQAELNLGYTTIAAPVDGSVAARTVRQGQYVAVGSQLMAVVPLQRVYVIANFKETQLTDVRVGQPVEIAVDTYPDRAITGHVESLAPASGLEFSLLPPDNATGNFTKIVQRIPVKIALDPEATGAGLLRPGMSVEASIDTRAPAAAGR